MKIGILGAGSLGSLYGANLAIANEVTMICRRTEQCELINEKGLIIEENGEDTVTRVNAVTNVSAVGTFDMVMVLVKGYDTATALKNILPAIGPQTIVFTLQNGLGNFEVISEFVSPENIVIGTSGQGAHVVEDNKVRYAGRGMDHLGCYGEDKSNARMCLDALKAAGFEAELDENIDYAIWNKLFINIGVNSVAALFDFPNEIVLESENAKNIVSLMLKEAVDVAERLGMDYDFEAVFDRFMEVVETIRANRCSMLQDITKGRKTEIDFINGAVVRTARRLGMRAPYNEFMTALIHTKEDCKKLKIFN